jgi:hypothetical protein
LTQTLLENALDHIREGVERFFSKDRPAPSEHKFGLSSLYTGALLLLKERLRRVHPSLILQPTKKNPQRTVDFHELLTRLDVQGGIRLSQADRDMLEAVRDLRNPIEHGEVALDLSDAEHMVAGLTSFAYLFARDHLGVELEHVLDSSAFLRVSQLKEIGERLNAEFTEYQVSWWKTISAKYARTPIRKLLALRDLEPFHPRHNPDPERLHLCPSCCEATVVRIEEGAAMLCTNPNCRELHSPKECERCGEPTFDDDSFLCDACSDQVFGGD